MLDNVGAIAGRETDNGGISPPHPGGCGLVFMRVDGGQIVVFFLASRMSRGDSDVNAAPL